jgi:cytochrome b
MAGEPLDTPKVRAKLWDGPTRIVHWALVILMGLAWWSVEANQTEWHLWAGYGILGLIVFRLIWGFAGSASARFTSFVKGPITTLAYAKTLSRRSAGDMAGHNPLGGWSVVAILAAILSQVITGLFAVDVDGLESGPLSDRVSFETGRLFSKWHDLSFTAIKLLVVLHLSAIAFYALYKRANLITPMITGYKSFETDPKLRFAPLWRAAFGAGAAAAVTWWVMKGLRL